MAIKISPEDYTAIESHGEETFPNECCGFMLGNANGDSRELVDLLRADNDREGEHQHNRFLITPEAFMKNEKTARKKGLDIIGFYHSHPDSPARPSQYDLDHALPWYSYVIVSIMDKSAADMKSWILAEDRSAFGEEPIVSSE